MSRAAVQWVRNVPQRDGGRMTDGQLDAAVRRAKREGWRCRTGFSRTRSMLGPRRVARKRGVAACGGITAFTLGRAAPSE
jgi:hypothetical protein